MHLRRSAAAGVPAIAATLLATVLHIHQSPAVYDHKPLWPLDARDFVTGGLGALALIAAALGGVGGGGILLPIYILVLGFRIKQAVALANVTILGGAIANVMFAARRRHPYADRPSINWSLIVLFEPLVIFGSVLGSFANKLLPEALLMVILVLLYGSLSYATTRKALAQVHEEGGWRFLFKRLPPTTRGQDTSSGSSSKGRGVGADGAEGEEEGKRRETTGLLGGRPRGQSYPPAQERLPPRAPTPQGGAGGGRASYGSVPAPASLSQQQGGTPKDDYSITGYSSEEGKDVPSPPLVVKRRVVQKIKARERSVDWRKPALMTLCFVGMAALRIAQKAVRCGSLLYWSLQLALVPWVLPFFLIARRSVLQEFRRKRRFGYPPAPGDVRWDRGNSIRWPLVCSAAGVMSGMLGSSGGTIKAPLLLELGTPPTVVSATVAQMIFFTSATSTLTLTVFGLLPFDYGALLFAFGFCTTTVTDWAALRLFGKRRKQSLAMLSIATVISLSTVAMGLEAGVRIGQEPSSAVEFGTLC